MCPTLASPTSTSKGCSSLLPALTIPRPQSPSLLKSLCLIPLLMGSTSSHFFPQWLSIPSLSSRPRPTHMACGEAEAGAHSTRQPWHLFLWGFLPSASQWPRRGLPSAPVDRYRGWNGVGLARAGMEVAVDFRDLASPLPFSLGQQSSRDEQGACAVLAVHLNTLLGERPVQHREVQGNESDLFMSYFPRGLKYRVSSTSKSSLPGLLSQPTRVSGWILSCGKPGHTWGLVSTCVSQSNEW